MGGRRRLNAILTAQDYVQSLVRNQRRAKARSLTSLKRGTKVLMLGPGGLEAEASRCRPFEVHWVTRHGDGTVSLRVHDEESVHEYSREVVAYVEV